MTIVKKTLTYIALAALLLSTNLVADDITDTMEEAMSAYKKGDYVQAKEDLTYVMELLKQKKGDTIKGFLPEALDGWKAEEAKSETAGSGMLGGGATTSRVYTKDKSKVIIEVVTDSPLLQGLGSLLGNPMFNSGGKLKRINREKATIKYNEKNQSGDVTLMLDKRFLITVKGSKVTEDELVEYAKAIDFKKIKEQ
jgi:hypothetical protein